MRVEFETAHKFEHLVDWHAVSEHAGNKFGIVPVFWIELVAESFDGSLVAAFVDELEVVALVSIGIDCFDDFTFGYRFGAEDSVVVVG